MSLGLKIMTDRLYMTLAVVYVKERTKQLILTTYVNYEWSNITWHSLTPDPARGRGRTKLAPGGMLQLE